jgi:hypothetical protein
MLSSVMTTWRVEDAARRVIQAPKPEPRIMRYELNDYEWAAIKPFQPNKSRGADRRYDADWIRALAVKRGVWANIPPRCNR